MTKKKKKKFFVISTFVAQHAQTHIQNVHNISAAIHLCVCVCARARGLFLEAAGRFVQRNSCPVFSLFFSFFCVCVCVKRSHGYGRRHLNVSFSLSTSPSLQTAPSLPWCFIFKRPTSNSGCPPHDNWIESSDIRFCLLKKKGKLH